MLRKEDCRTNLDLIAYYYAQELMQRGIDPETIPNRRYTKAFCININDRRVTDQDIENESIRLFCLDCGCTYHKGGRFAYPVGWVWARCVFCESGNLEVQDAQLKVKRKRRLAAMRHREEESQNNEIHIDLG